ncbi:matrixin family metalloprotease [Acinetobacter sp. MD2]|uniref:matrixin family metalloprotease n=1 Tax=Acinetobacter sp. MD2 TaxID=2600066 RepID=UPI002D7A102E|nr:matrixin family metalloprotease [Acinetobacter sp. MD2]
MLFQQLRHPQIKLNPISSRILHPLDTRLHYRIGEIDPRFQLSQNEIQQLTQQATEIWQNGTGRTLFVYDPKAQLSINFIYDERQNQTNLRIKQQTQIQVSQAQQHRQQQFIDTEKQAIQQSKAFIDQKQAELQSAVVQYNQIIKQINQHGGAEPALKERLEQQKFDLEQRKQALSLAVQAHNQTVAESNRHVAYYNQNNQAIDQSIQHYNQRYAAKMFDKGLFNGKEINVYEFENKDDLRLVLAHELGHALGLKHVEDNPKALMYPILKQQNIQSFELTNSDLALLKQHSYGL